MEQYINILEAAARLNVSRITVHRLIHAGEIKAHKKTLASNSGYLVDAASVAAFDARRRAPASEAKPVA